MNYIISFILVIIGILLLFTFLFTSDKPYQEFCKKNGYEEKIPANLETGYIKCCSRLLINHEYQNNAKCEILEYSNKLIGG